MVYKDIPENWENNTLENVCFRIFSGGTPSRKESNFWDGDINWFSSGETRNRFVTNTEEKITQAGVDNSSTKLSQPNDVLMASAGQGFTRGQVSYNLINTYINQSVISLRTDKDKLDSRFLFYNLSGRYEELRKISDGNSIRGSITTEMLKKFSIIVPPLVEQRSIVSILSSLDDKIETNNKIIANLESQAQAIFKSWFVDFEPFQDGEFVESELGMIPEGWEAVPIKEMSRSVITGKTPSTKNKEFFGNYMPFIKIPDMHNKIYTITTEVYLSETGVQSQKNKTLPMNSICVSCIATVGLVNLVLEESQTNQQINSIIPNEVISPYYLYFAMKNLYDYLNSIASGSTQKNINKRDFESIKIINPSHEIMDRYHNFSKPLFELIKNLQLQNQKLAQIRDTLLPKLMLGEIRVGQDDIEEIENLL